jgi:tetratricopeptide (TPR) repeat protein
MALITKANSLAELGRPTESTALLTHAIKLALDLDLAAEAVRGYYNLADNVMAQGRFAEAHELLDQGLEVARRRGDRLGERRLLGQRMIASVALGRWDEAMANAALLGDHADVWSTQATVQLPVVLAARGDYEGIGELFDSRTPSWPAVDAAVRVGRATALRGQPGVRELIVEARGATLRLVPHGTSEMPMVFAELLDAAFAADDLVTVTTLLDAVDSLKPAQLIPLLDAEATRGRARLLARSGDTEKAEQWFRRAIDIFQELETPFFLARAQLEYAELLGTSGEEEGGALNGARATFESLHATPWLERAQALRPMVAA